MTIRGLIPRAIFSIILAEPHDRRSSPAMRRRVRFDLAELRLRQIYEFPLLDVAGTVVIRHCGSGVGVM
jgi:hypothetical protein